MAKRKRMVFDGGGVREIRQSSPSLLKASVSPDALRAATKAEKVKLGYTGKARVFIRKYTTRVTKRTPLISERQYDKKVTGFTREKAAEARAHGALDYKTAQAQETAAKARAKRAEPGYARDFLHATARDAAAGVRIAKAGGKNGGKVSFPVKVDSATQALRNRERRLQGKFIPDGEYQMMLDYSAHYSDPFYELMRGSPKDKTGNIQDV
jgi:hypothetical protein